ncbi:MAG: SDR family NAD(P)-dependent oxidoreductase, partial [Myxococcales bacterium]|nr:SDR family NAD(P)-dependent oxidoreductase [Myxococcales bacterium]
MKLEQVKAIVTGGASGMGRYFCEQLVAGGAKVTIADVDGEGAAALAKELGAAAVAATCDVSDEASVTALIATASKAMGGLNVLVNNAGIFRDGLLVKQDRETGAVSKMSLPQWQKVIDVDLTGPFLCTREFAAHVIENKQAPAVVVNMSSVARHGNRGQSNYSAAKAGLVADTKLWGVELARFGIRVGAIAPGFIDTPILQGMRDDVLAGL